MPFAFLGNCANMPKVSPVKILKEEVCIQIFNLIEFDKIFNVFISFFSGCGTSNSTSFDE